MLRWVWQVQRPQFFHLQLENPGVVTAFQKLCEKAVVGCHEDMTVTLHNENIAFGPDARVDDGEVDGPLREPLV